MNYTKNLLAIFLATITLEAQSKSQEAPDDAEPSSTRPSFVGRLWETGVNKIELAGQYTYKKGQEACTYAYDHPYQTAAIVAGAVIVIGGIAYYANNRGNSSSSGGISSSSSIPVIPVSGITPGGDITPGENGPVTHIVESLSSAQEELQNPNSDPRKFGHHMNVALETAREKLSNAQPSSSEHPVEGSSLVEFLESNNKALKEGSPNTLGKTLTHMIDGTLQYGTSLAPIAGGSQP